MSRKIVFLLSLVVLLILAAVITPGWGVQPVRARVPTALLYSQDFDNPSLDLAYADYPAVTNAILAEGWYAQGNAVPVEADTCEPAVDDWGGTARGYHTCPASGELDRAFGFYKSAPANVSYIRFTYTAPANVNNLSIEFDWESTWSRFDSTTYREVAMRGPGPYDPNSMGYQIGAASRVNFSPASFAGGVKGNNSLISTNTVTKWLSDSQMAAANLRIPSITHSFTGVSLNACDTFQVFWYGTTNLTNDKNMQNNIDNFELFGNMVPAVASLVVSVDPDPSEINQQTTLKVDFSVAGLCADADGSLQFTVDGIAVGEPLPVDGNDIYTIDNYIFSTGGDYEVCVAYTPGNELIQTPNDPTCITHTVTVPPPLGDSIYLSSSTNGRLTGTNIYGQSWDFEYSDEDVLYFDGYVWAIFFDGSAYGLANNDIDGFAFGPNNTILFSLEGAFVLPNSTATEGSDVIQYDPQTGTFSLFFDGSDVGLSGSEENVDALEWVDNGGLGLLYVSTSGTPLISGLFGMYDEDILLFTPTKLGTTTTGSWTQYLDGSGAGVKLSQTNSEDVNAFGLSSGAHYLSTLGTFSVGTVSGEGLDVFSGTRNSKTSMTYSATLTFNGLPMGFSGSVDAFEIMPDRVED